MLVRAPVFGWHWGNIQCFSSLCLLIFPPARKSGLRGFWLSSLSGWYWWASDYLFACMGRGAKVTSEDLGFYLSLFVNLNSWDWPVQHMISDIYSTYRQNNWIMHNSPVKNANQALNSIFISLSEWICLYHIKSILLKICLRGYCDTVYL